MTIHETRTHLTPTEVIERALSFFALAGSSYAAFPDRIEEGFLKLHMEVGEILIGAVPHGDWTWVRGSASRGGHLLTRFLTTLGPPLDANQTTYRHGQHETLGAQVGVMTVRPPERAGARRLTGATAA